MLKRQESSLSSSRRQGATTPPPSEIRHAKAISCMSGIFQFFSKYQNPNKRITFGRKQEKLKPLSTDKSKKSPPAAKNNKTEKQTSDDTKRLTCGNKVQRSPTLPPEIRRSNAAAANTPENSRTPPSSLVAPLARLMGLEDLGAPAKKATAAEEADRVMEKRLLLIQALEKCNEDLEALKRIIKAVQIADNVRIQPPIPAATADKRVQPGCGSAVAEEANIPAVLAGEITRSPPDHISIVQNFNPGATRVPQQRKLTAARKPGEDDEPIGKLLDKSTIAVDSSLHMRRQTVACAVVTQSWCSRAMVKSVEEVCGDITWGKKREIGRIGFVLQDHLCRELIEELVRELKSCTIHSLPFEACKRRLCF